MIVTSKTDKEKWALFLFLQEHNVLQTRSEDFQAIGRVSADPVRLRGVIGYNGFVGNTCCIHVAGVDNWLNRDLLWAAFHYPFVQCGMEHLIGMVAADNLKAIRLNRHLGFEVLHRLRNGWAKGIDLIVMRMMKNQCRWLKLKESEHVQQAA